jgi:hypothetical protein
MQPVIAELYDEVVFKNLDLDFFRRCLLRYTESSAYGGKGESSAAVSIKQEPLPVPVAQTGPPNKKTKHSASASAPAQPVIRVSNILPVSWYDRKCQALAMMCNALLCHAIVCTGILDNDC